MNQHDVLTLVVESNKPNTNYICYSKGKARELIDIDYRPDDRKDLPRNEGPSIKLTLKTAAHAALAEKVGNLPIIGLSKNWRDALTGWDNLIDNGIKPSVADVNARQCPEGVAQEGFESNRRYLLTTGTLFETGDGMVVNLCVKDNNQISIFKIQKEPGHDGHTPTGNESYGAEGTRDITMPEVILICKKLAELGLQLPQDFEPTLQSAVSKARHRWEAGNKERGIEYSGADTTVDFTAESRGYIVS